ncbi:11910_t:CDS:2 [Dentiscutata heterogama]|uniref:11910_t:CDS:1 n=1 Tax=Dentiscutata heterogama TaxID=1316150 RepID=A0ACA9KBZ5_9GLOM|nr:11910_t:CDS:2 [Dentiscutata heterogama]
MLQILQKLNLTIHDVFVIFLISIISYIVYVAIKYPDRALGTRSRKDLVGPKGFPIFGNAFSFLRRKTYIHYEQDLANKYGPLLIVSNDPQTIEHILKSDFENYEKSDVLRELGYEIFGDGIFVINGLHKWKFQRKIISRMFLGKNFRNLIYSSMIRKSQTLIDILTKYADSGNPIDLQDLFYKFTIDTFGDISFGVDFGCLTHPEEKSQFVTNLNYALEVMNERFEQPLWKFIENWE